MLGNKLQNSMADLGSNLVTAMQPALDTVNDILDAFNNLSEVDQTRIIKVMGALAVTGLSNSQDDQEPADFATESESPTPSPSGGAVDAARG